MKSREVLTASDDQVGNEISRICCVACKSPLSSQCDVMTSRVQT